MEKKGVALVLHGFPEGDVTLPAGSPVMDYLSSRGFETVLPRFFLDPKPLSISNAKKLIIRELAGREPNVIIGISMGGLLAPHAALEYPRAKLVLIGTGPYLRTGIPFYDFLIHLEARDPTLVLVRLARKIPKGIYELVYRFFNTQKEAFTDSEYRKRADENLENFSVIPLAKIREILEFITTSDTRLLLPRLIQPTIIFASSSDVIMPLALSRILNDLIPSSQLVISDRVHHDVFTEADYPRLDTFLGHDEHALSG